LETLSDKINNSAVQIIKTWMIENPKENPLNIVQQINYASLLLRTMGSKAESYYKKSFGKTTNDLH
jgi:hypothetical protein